MSTEDIQGYAIRRHNSCEEEEVSCGSTWSDSWYACCPHGSVCPGADTRYANNICCPNKMNCTAYIDDPPVCADKTWDLYENDGPFCCEQGEKGFNVRDTTWVGCLGNDTEEESRFIGLTPISTGAVSITSTTSVSPISLLSTSTSSSTSAATTGATEPETNGSKSHTGAIAGGVVGGVAGVAVIAIIAFFLLRRRRKHQPESVAYHAPQYMYQEQERDFGPQELQATSIPAEYAAKSEGRHELPANHAY